MSAVLGLIKLRASLLLVLRISLKFLTSKKLIRIFSWEFQFLIAVRESYTVTNITVISRALVRPGRFDSRVTVPMPDVRARKSILELHLGKIQLADGKNIVRIMHTFEN